VAVYSSFAVTEIGGSHIKHGKECQDASCKYSGDAVSVAVVADGHGDDNCFRSDRGADFAVKCAAKGIAGFVEFHKAKFSPGFFSEIFKKTERPSHDDFGKALSDLVKHIIALWQNEVEKDHAACPFTAEELEKVDEKHRKRFGAGEKTSKAYGTTLIAAAVTPYYWFGIHIGDGRLTALYPDGSFNQPVPWDERCYLNVTTSICDDEAFEQARHYFSFIPSGDSGPAAVFLCTDGVDDNYPVDGNERHLFKLYRTIALTFAKEGFASTEKQLKELANAFATKGKGDDTSIAGFVDMEALRLAVPAWERQVAQEEAASVAGKAAKDAASVEKEKPAKNADLSYGTFVTGSQHIEKKQSLQEDKSEQ